MVMHGFEFGYRQGIGVGNKQANGRNGGKVNGNGRLQEDFMHGIMAKQKYAAEKLKW